MSGLIDPAVGATEVTPSDTEDLTEICRGIWVGGQGNIKMDMADGDTVTFIGAAAGVVHPLQARRIYATGSTATNIIVLY